MVSRVSTIMATAIPLGLLLILSVSTSIYLYLTLIRHQKRHRLNTLEAERQLQAQQQKTENLSKVFDKHENKAGVYSADLMWSFKKTYWSLEAPLETYLQKWIKYDEAQVSIPLETSRLQRLLFPETPVDADGASETDFDPFPNPQHYTSNEIAEFLKTPNAIYIIKHIIVSTLLTNTSIDGNMFRTLLPLEPADISSLHNISTAVRNGLDLDDRLKAHICMFGLCKAMDPEGEAIRCKRKPYHTFFEALLEPFFISSSAEDVAARKVDMDEVISASVAHGMKALAFIPEVEYRWGEKQESLTGPILTSPAMWMVQFDLGKYFGSEEMAGATSLR